MSEPVPHHQEDEILFDMLKDEFAFFYAVSVTVMDVLKHMSNDASSDDAAHH